VKLRTSAPMFLRRSTSPIMNATRSRTSTIWIGSVAVPGTAMSPPRATRTGQ